MNGRTFAIALTSFREALRDRILFAVLGLGAASVLFGLGLGSLSYAESVRIVVDHGLVTISLLANLIAISLVPKSKSITLRPDCTIEGRMLLPKSWALSSSRASRRSSSASTLVLKM